MTAVVDRPRVERGSDARKAQKFWDNLEPIADLGEYALYVLATPNDLSEESRFIHNCARSHKHMVEAGREMLLSLRDKKTQTPHCTVLLTAADYQGGYGISTYRGMVECVTIEDKRWKVSQASLRGTAGADYNYLENDKQRTYLDLVLAWLQSLPHEVKFVPNTGERW